MGGFGSGRYRWSPRDTVEDWRYRSFGIKEWVDRGLVRPGHAFTQIWLSKDGRPAASIDVQISTVSPVNRHLAVLLSDRSAVPDRLQAVLKYRAGRSGEELRDIEEAVWLDTKPCGFKGQRLQFMCPGCGRRIAELYPDGVHFRCRKCCGLGYRSQRKGREARGLNEPSHRHACWRPPRRAACRRGAGGGETPAPLLPYVRSRYDAVEQIYPLLPAPA